ncbi:metal ABC transporter solute-binding protein, Zn/Mn family [Mycobacterium sp. E2733]|uniref:metal ABC transporter solute-binding protein, Zn/Mn family n=1 Tax=Mycobacterium sp. E2733 TaxID=1834138 RepID=UPI0007FDF360|nr:zinc ABC transporter substrate-binding protein [Mycobacterium sp. E2733]OBH93038.1 ABC transporter substrate-binding protein [Mycobacterium sp. E2733]
MALKRGRGGVATAPRWLLAALVLLAVGTASIGCGSPAHPRADAVVASTGVWGSVARAVTGRHVAVTSLLSGGDTDPHSYQASPSDAAAITDAALVVYNGGGYDPWVDQVLAEHPGVKSIGAYSFLKNAGTGEQPANEHVFYNLDVAKSVAFAIADRMAVVDPVHAADYRANAAEFCRGADAIAISEHAIAGAYPGAGVIATEPVGYYLLAAAGLVNRTPPAFAAANENETDPAPADMAFVLDLIDHRQLSAVLVNPQTSTAAINGVRDAARRVGVPVTEVSETLPDGTDYLTWQRNTVSRLLTALQSGRSVEP